nr:hypothetical protein [Bradyrhizobium nanningense]
MKVPGNFLQVSRCLQVHDNDLVRKDITLLLGFDFHEYVSITKTTPTKGRTYPNFRPDRSQIKSGEGYWTMGVDKRNNVAILAAARLYELSNTNLSEHLQSLRAFYTDPTKHSHPRDRCACIAPTAKKITGKVAYHGDYWLRSDLRGQGLSKIMARITHGLSFAMWDPDYLCGLVARWSLDKGIVAEYGYTHSERGGSILHLVEDNIVDDDWLVWRTREDLRSQFDRQDGNSSILDCSSPSSRLRQFPATHSESAVSETPRPTSTTL